MRSDLSRAANTAYMVSRANRKLWVLRRLKALGANYEDLKEVYTKQIRCILEYAAPVWHSSVTGQDRNHIERVQKSAFRIILGEQYQSYTSALKYLKLDTLFNRRQKLCMKFGKKCLNHHKFKEWFKTLHPSNLQTE